MWYSMRSMIEKKTMTMEQTFFLDSYVVFKRRVGVFIFRVLKVRLELCLFSFFFFVRDLSCVLCVDYNTLE